ncbi:MAG: hypothetical protein JXR03_14465 [Cyclobacteriaceae bacterium]
MIIRTSLVGFTLIFLLILILRKEQNQDLNWAIFYSALWVLVSLLPMNWVCIKLGFWSFNHSENLTVFMPYDLLFVWLIIWGVLPTFIFKGNRLWLVATILFWTDILFMPYMESFGIIDLGKYWLIGEVLLILIVFFPAFLWSRFSLRKIHTGFRSLFQFACIAFIICLGIPFVTLQYFPKNVDFHTWYVPYLIQLGFIIIFPSLIALIDLHEKGKGTPFPYDPTKQLVRTGVYAYIRNPIQWSLTLFFIPLSAFYMSPVLLAGVVISIAYTIGLSNPQEFSSMESRFGLEWTNYKSTVPSWYFLWVPKSHPIGTIYFRKNCSSCSSVRSWFERRKTFGLIFKHAEDYEGEILQQVKYVSYNGIEVSSVNAIANGLEHINLGWASLGWFMRLPGVNFVLQLIIDSMIFEGEDTFCEIEDVV